MEEKQRVSIFQFAKTACYIGSTGYGGPAIVARIYKFFVHENKWITEKEFTDGLSIAQLLPGATTVTLIGYIGLRLAGVFGLLLLPLAYITPAFTMVVILSGLYFSYGQLACVHSLMRGLGAFVVALLLHATITMGKSVFSVHRLQITRCIICLVAFLAFLYASVNVIFIILFSGLLGVLFRLGKCFRTLPKKHGILLCGNQEGSFFPLFVLAALLGGAIFFPTTEKIVKEFLLIGTFSFGGGFAAVPLLQEAIVTKFNWLTFEQFRDGIALGQITPGPVFITAAFIGYHVLGVLGALLATITVFSPSLCLIIPMVRLFSWLEESSVFYSLTQGLLIGFVGILLGTTLQFGHISLVTWQAWIIFLGTVVWMVYYRRDLTVPMIATILFSLTFL
jgi:chromate transporter